jgi:chromosome segregation ATPase
LKKNIALCDLDIKNLTERREKEKKEIEDIFIGINNLKEELKDYKEDVVLQGFMEDKERRRDTTEKELDAIKNKKAEIKGKVLHLKQSADKIIKIDNCPFCLQNVNHNHKQGIIDKTNAEIRELQEEFEKLAVSEKEIFSQFEFLKNECKELKDKLYNQRVLKVKKDNLTEKEHRLSKLREGFDSYKQRIGEINSRKIELQNPSTLS